jgi:hypothetical protein
VLGCGWDVKMGEVGVDVKTLELRRKGRFKEDGGGPRPEGGGEDERGKGDPRAPRFPPPLLKLSSTMEGVVVGGNRWVIEDKREMAPIEEEGGRML